jgi:hypothetical protein
LLNIGLTAAEEQHMRIKCVLSALTTVLAVALAGSPASADFTGPLPDPNCGTVAGSNCLVFSDFTVYSMDLLNFQATGHVVNGNDPFKVKTGGSDLSNSLVVASGVGGVALQNSDLIGGGLVDDAYAVPNSGGGTINYLMTGNATGDGANVPGVNSPSTWDVDVASLVDYLGGGQLAFFFNLNQTKSQNYLDNPSDALGWLAVTLTDTRPGGNAPVTFYLNGNNCTGVLGAPTTGPGGDPNNANCDPTQSYTGTSPPLTPAQLAETSILPAGEQWAYIHGTLCVSSAGAVVHFGPCDGSEDSSLDAKSIDQNLGRDLAAFGLYSDKLQTALLSGDYTKMSVDLRMASEDNGYEQLIIRALPEPLTVSLFGMGLLGLTMLRRRKLIRA